MSNRIRVVWLTQFSNPEVRTRLHFRVPIIERLIRKIKHREYPPQADYCQWVTNAIKEFEKIDDVELHIIAPVLKLAVPVCNFVMNGVFYHFYQDEAGTDREFMLRMFSKRHFCRYRKNRRYVKSLLAEINPEIVHLFGAENLNNAYSLLDAPKGVPTIVQLQTLLSDPLFRERSEMPEYEYEKRLECEQTVIRSANFVGTGCLDFIPIIHSDIAPNIVTLYMPLALAEAIDVSQENKEFDFVYFARNISKAADWAIEAFAIAQKKHPDISLHIIGSYTDGYKASLMGRILELGIDNHVVFEGELPTHDDVIQRIRKAKVALLPLKVDNISGTVREAMSNGIPVVTTITPGTPSLNLKRESVLLSEKGDFEGMAANMIKLIENTSYLELLVKNASLTMRDWSDNYKSMLQSVKVYKACIDNSIEGTPIPAELIR